MTAMLPTHAAVTAGTHDPFMEVEPRPKNQSNEVKSISQRIIRK